MAENKDWYIPWIIKKSGEKTGTFKFLEGNISWQKLKFINSLSLLFRPHKCTYTHTMYMHTYMPGVYTKVFVTKGKKSINDLYVK